MFDVDAFIGSCQTCLDETEPRRAIREVLARTVSDPGAVADVMRPERAGLTLLYRSDFLTITNVVWAPGMEIFPHDHRMWACIGIYSGREDNRFFRRPQVGAKGLVDSGAKRLDEGDVTLLGADTIHSVTNPLGSLTGALHVYGGDFVAEPRSCWREPSFAEEPYDGELTMQLFAEANERWQAG